MTQISSEFTMANVVHRILVSRLSEQRNAADSASDQSAHSPITRNGGRTPSWYRKSVLTDFLSTTAYRVGLGSGVRRRLQLSHWYAVLVASFHPSILHLSLPRIIGYCSSPIHIFLLFGETSTENAHSQSRPSRRTVVFAPMRQVQGGVQHGQHYMTSLALAMGFKLRAPLDRVSCDGQRSQMDGTTCSPYRTFVVPNCRRDG